MKKYFAIVLALALGAAAISYSTSTKINSLTRNNVGALATILGGESFSLGESHGLIAVKNPEINNVTTSNHVEYYARMGSMMYVTGYYLATAISGTIENKIPLGLTIDPIINDNGGKPNGRNGWASYTDTGSAQYYGLPFTLVSDPATIRWFNLTQGTAISWSNTSPVTPDGSDFIRYTYLIPIKEWR